MNPAGARDQYQEQFHGYTNPENPGNAAGEQATTQSSSGYSGQGYGSQSGYYNSASQPSTGFPQSKPSTYDQSKPVKYPQTGSGYNASGQSGYNASGQSGYVQPPQSGYTQPPQSGYTQPAQSGYSQSAKSDYSQSGQGNYSNTGQSGYSQRSQSGYGEEQSGYDNSSSAQGYDNYNYGSEDYSGYNNGDGGVKEDYYSEQNYQGKYDSNVSDTQSTGYRGKRGGRGDNQSNNYRGGRDYQSNSNRGGRDYQTSNTRGGRDYQSNNNRGGRDYQSNSSRGGRDYQSNSNRGGNYQSRGRGNSNDRPQRGGANWGYKDIAQSKKNYENSWVVGEDPSGYSKSATPAVKALMDTDTVDYSSTQADVKMEGVELDAGAENGEKKKPFYRRLMGEDGKVKKRTPNPNHKHISVRRYVAPKNALMCLRESGTDALNFIEEPTTSQDGCLFTISVEVNGVKYTGSGSSKDLAKHAASESALAGLLKNPTEGQTPWSSIASFAMYKLFREWNIPANNTIMGKGNLDAEEEAPAVSNGDEAENLNESQEGTTPMEPKIANKPKVLPENAATMNPVMLINQMIPGVSYNVSQTMNGTVTHFTVASQLRDSTFTGSGPSIKKAKLELAKAALKGLFDIDSTWNVGQ